MKKPKISRIINDPLFFCVHELQIFCDMSYDNKDKKESEAQISDISISKI